MKLDTDCRSKEHPRPPSSNQSKPRANLPSRKSSLHNEPEGDVMTRSIGHRRWIEGRVSVGKGAMNDSEYPLSKDFPAR